METTNIILDLVRQKFRAMGSLLVNTSLSSVEGSRGQAQGQEEDEEGGDKSETEDNKSEGEGD